MSINIDIKFDKIFITSKSNFRKHFQGSTVDILNSIKENTEVHKILNAIKEDVDKRSNSFYSNITLKFFLANTNKNETQNEGTQQTTLVMKMSCEMTNIKF